MNRATLGAVVVESIEGGDPITVISMAPAYNCFTPGSGSPARYVAIGSVHRSTADAIAGWWGTGAV